MEKKLEKIASQVDTFLSSRKLHTSLQIIKITGVLEEGRQILQQLDLDIKCRPTSQKTDLK